MILVFYIGLNIRVTKLPNSDDVMCKLWYLKATEGKGKGNWLVLILPHWYTGCIDKEIYITALLVKTYEQLKLHHISSYQSRVSQRHDTFLLLIRWPLPSVSRVDMQNSLKMFRDDGISFSPAKST